MLRSYIAKWEGNYTHGVIYIMSGVQFLDLYWGRNRVNKGYL